MTVSEHQAAKQICKVSRYTTCRYRLAAYYRDVISVTVAAKQTTDAFALLGGGVLFCHVVGPGQIQCKRLGKSLSGLGGLTSVKDAGWKPLSN